MTSCRVSVIIPTFNRAALIGETLECMLRQTLAPHEVIVVDDGSDDATASVVGAFGNRVTLVEQANAGPGAARNRGLAMATGNLIQFFDSDDLCTLDKLEKQAAALVSTGADFAYSAWTPAWLESGCARTDSVAYQQGPLPLSGISAYLRGWLTLMQACLMRRDAIVRWGGYPDHARTGEDLELLFRAIIGGGRFVHVPGPLLLLRQHPGTQISAAPELAGMRAQDMVTLTRIVNDLTRATENDSSALDRFFWRAKQWHALRERAMMLPGAPPVASRPLYAALLQARRVARGLRARRKGYRLESFFAPAEFSEAQYDGVRALGYELIPN
jgi:glycosyltransferase involved in cell wall biosynthesis